MLAKREQGGSTLFFLFFLFLFSTFLYVNWILIPVYIENKSVKRALHALSSKNIISKNQDYSANKGAIFSYLGKLFRINNIKHVDVDNVTVKSKDKLYIVNITYQVKQHLVGNLDVLLSFDDRVEVEAH